MRPVPTLLALSFVAGCMTSAPSVQGPSTASASLAAFTVDPRPEPTTLPALSPPTRTNREIEAMDSAALARWILPAQSSEIAAAEIYPARWGVITSAFLWRAPRPAGPAGICEVDGYGVAFRVENERSLTPQQSLDPPLRPVWTLPERRFRVAGTTVAPGTLDCNQGRPFWGWSEAPSAEAIHLAARLIEQAQMRARGTKALGFRLSCTQMQVDERTGASSDRACPDARAFVQRLTPDLIQRVRSSQCEGDISAMSEGECIAVEYHDPNAPRTHSIYMVRIAGGDGPRAVEIVQGMLPPH